MVPATEKFGVFVRFWISQLAFNVWRCFGAEPEGFRERKIPAELARAFDRAAMFVAIIVQRAECKAAVLKKPSGEPPQIPRFGLPIRFARSEKFEPVPELFDALPPNKTVRACPCARSRCS